MSFQDISCEDAKRLIQDGAKLVDVRSAREYQQGCLPGAINAPLEIFRGALAKISLDEPVILYCSTGRRSGQAKTFMQSLGFNAVHNLGSLRNYFNCIDPEVCLADAP